MKRECGSTDLIPKMGLSDGIIHYMYDEYLKKDKNFLGH